MGCGQVQQAVERVNQLGASDILVGTTLVVTNEEHRFLSLEQLRELKNINATLLLEPVGRNTAPALTLAALQATEDGGDPILVVTPADQAVVDATAFSAATETAIKLAADGSIVILGVTPDRPETGYGYIQVEAGSAAAGIHTSAHAVKRFVEKPSVSVAQQYLSEGCYFWNAGMFVLKASIWLHALEKFRPDIHHASIQAWNKRSADANSGSTFVRPGRAEFTAIPAESVDYAVMEHCPGSSVPIHMVPLEAGWSDLGAWDAVWNVLPKDDQGNAHVGDVLTTQTRNTMVHASSRLVSLVGVSDLIVVETADAVLVADKACSQDVKHIVAHLQSFNREEHVLHRKVHRPWGWYDNIDEGSRFKVKRIQVNPKASLSLQKHHHRAEHWIVVAGTAEITNGDKVLTLTENQSTYIPLGEVHRLANPGNTPLEIIEVQSGAYLGEDDIVRFEDTYGRVS